jgi:putative intracellular protease/amidase
MKTSFFKITLLILSLSITSIQKLKAQVITKTETKPINFSNKKNKIVIIVSSYGKDNGKQRPGFEMEEFSQAYLIFKANDLIIDVASPKGGKVDLGQFNKEKPYNKLILNDTIVMRMFDHTIPTANLDANDYDALYVVGGKGPMFDLVVDPSLQDFIVEMNKKKSIIATICHGTIALANIKIDDKYFVENKTLTGFCNDEEKMFSKKDSEFPFLLEDRLLLRGAKYKKIDAMLPYMLRDDNLITGQNPFSTNLVAEEIVKSLGKTPVKRDKLKDEISMELIKDFTETNSIFTKKELQKKSDSYDMKLIASYGYYHAMHADEDIVKLKKAVSIIELVVPYYFNENIYISLSEYYLKLGDKSNATNILNKILENNPQSEKATKLLGNIKK